MILAALVWHVLTIGEMTGASPCGERPMPTHVEVVGYPTYCRWQEDGDLHVRLCDSPKVKGMDRTRCIVAECIPALPCECPPRGRPVTARGIRRYDDERGHRWWEIHPVLHMGVP